MIVIIDYGIGNLGAVSNMLRKIGAEVIVSSSITDIEDADKLILPGVGAFDNGMRRLKELGFDQVLSRKVLNEKTPILGICLGMQLFTKRSEEGDFPGLGWIDGETVRFRFEDDQRNLKVPHIGWNTVTMDKSSCMFDGIQEEPRFYFVHSYHVVCNNQKDVLTRTTYGYEFVSAIQTDNIIGVQFHPEKSHKFGLQLLKNFIMGPKDA